MPFISTVPPSPSNKAQMKLPKDGLKVDWRACIKQGYFENHPCYNLRFRCTVTGDILTIQRNDEYHWIDGWNHELFFRVYDPEKEDVPDFDSSKPYTYHGLEHEQAPYDVQEVFIHPSVRVIKPFAFYKCRMRKCTMGDHVEIIEKRAFYGCYSLESIRLSRALTSIGFAAFESCHSIGCIFVPPSVTDIHHRAFAGCMDAKMLVLPPNLDSEHIGEMIVSKSRNLLYLQSLYSDDNKSKSSSNANGATTSMTYEIEGETIVNNDEVNQWIHHRYDHLPLHKLCADPDVTADMIRKCVREHGTGEAYRADSEMHQLLPLHILCGINKPHVGLDAIVACFEANPGALFTPDSIGTTPLEYLWDKSHTDVIIHLMQDLCIYRQSEWGAWRKWRNVTILQWKAGVRWTAGMIKYLCFDLILHALRWFFIILQLILALMLWSFDFWFGIIRKIFHW